MTISPQLIYEFNREIDTRVSVVEGETVSNNPPGTTINLDVVSGDDTNDGFINPVLTPEKAFEIINSYRWNGETVSINVTNATTGLVFDGEGLVGGICRIRILMNGTTLTSGTLIVRNIYEVVTQVNLENFTCTGSANISLVNLLDIQVNGVSFENQPFASFLINSNDVDNLFINGLNIENIAGFTGINLTNFDRITQNIRLSIASINGSNNFIGSFISFGTSSVNLFQFLSSPATTLTGKIYDTTNMRSSLVSIIDETSLVGTVPNDFTDTTIFNGIRVIPEFADNAAAVVGGLVIGNLYHNPAGDLKVVI